MKLLVLCHANRWRSPLTAAFVEKFSRGKVQVRSSGFKESGRPAGKPIRDAAVGLGLNLEAHKSTVISPMLYEWADVIIYMDGGNKKRLDSFEAKYIPEKKRKVSYCLGAYANPQLNRIPDPAFIRRDTPEFHEVVLTIQDASKRLTKKLISSS